MRRPAATPRRSIRSIRCRRSELPMASGITSKPSRCMASTTDIELRCRIMSLGAAALFVEVAVESTKVGEGAGFDDVGADSMSGHHAAFELDAHADLTNRVLATRHAADVIVV